MNEIKVASRTRQLCQITILYTSKTFSQGRKHLVITHNVRVLQKDSTAVANAMFLIVQNEIIHVWFVITVTLTSAIVNNRSLGENPTRSAVAGILNY